MKKKRIFYTLMGILLVSGALTGCSDKSSKQTVTPNTIQTEEINSKINIDDFDEKLLDFISEQTDGNYMISPLSFKYTLGLLLNGAAGETKTELMNAIGVKNEEKLTKICTTFNGFIQQFDEGLKNEIEEYKKAIKNGEIDKDSTEPYRALNVANSIWKNENIKEDFKEKYKEYITLNYAAEYKTFTEDNAVKLINEWVNEKTEQMIPKLFPDDYNTNDLAVALINTLYFKDNWSYSFDKDLTADGTFTTKDGSEVTKSFMQMTKSLQYYEDDATQLVILPMDGGVYMAFALGETDDISSKINKADYENVTVTIPKTDLETSFDNNELINFLNANDVYKAFNYEADFSNMIDEDIFISDIVQKTKLKLDEDGVEASAATIVMFIEKSDIASDTPKEFTANRPFSFYIYSNVNDNTVIMFAGEIVE